MEICFRGLLLLSVCSEAKNPIGPPLLPAVKTGERGAWSMVGWMGGAAVMFPWASQKSHL